VDNLAPVVVGGLLAVLGGFIGAWIQGRREHRAWLREKRYEAFVKVKVYMRDLAAFEADLHAARVSGDVMREDAVLDRGVDLWERLSEAMAPVVVLGPEAVNEAGTKLMTAIREADGDVDKFDDAQVAFVTAMQRSLGIRD
jgi:hypothetical protein